MVKWRVCSLTATAMFLAVLVMGCGGSSARLTGSISFTVEWPEPVVKSRLVPQATLSVRAEAHQGGVKVGEAVLVPPSDETRTSSGTIADVPEGEVTLTLYACPNSDGTGTPLASGSMVLTVVRNETAQANVTMESTVDRIEVQPPTVTLSPGATMQLTASPRNSEGDLVLVAESSLTWTSSDVGVADVDESGKVTAVAEGESEITITDSESGKSARVTVSVAGAAAMAGTSPDVLSAYVDGGILVMWSTPAGISSADIIEYHVWRDGDGTYSPGPGSGLVAAPDAVTAQPHSGAGGNFDHSIVDGLVAYANLSYRYADTDHQLVSATTDSVPGITRGQHQYWISCLYRRTDPGDGAITYWETSPVSAGRATYVSRPVPESPAQQETIVLSDVTFQWEGSGGANVYVIEASTAPTFARDDTWVDIIFQPTSVDGQSLFKTFVNVLSAAPELAGVDPDGILYWRVGARNSSDQPGPYPAGPSPTLEGDKMTRYIYSETQACQLGSSPGGGGGPPIPSAIP